MKRRTIQIGAEHQPVMWESEIVPVMLGNDYACRVIVDTAGKRYALELYLSQEEYERFQRQDGAARIERISGIAQKEGKPENVYWSINGKRRKCKLSNSVWVVDENAKPRHGYACAELLSGVGVLHPQVEIIELPEDTRRAYLDAMTTEKRSAAGKAPQPSPNPDGRPVESNTEEDAIIYSRWKDAQAPGRISIETFRDMNEDISKRFTLYQLHKLIDRARKRANHALRPKRAR